VGWIPHDELPIYLASSDIYVSTSLSDGTSVSLLEGMACSLAPVVSNIPANQPWIEDGVNGFLFPVHNHETLATRVTYLIKNAEKRRKFGKASRQIVQEKAEFETQMVKVEGIYQEMVKVTEASG
jgi:glycosyltransferase involved in cell wall biosynthesis